MNLTRALNVALPDIPARNLSQRAPRLDPGTTFREHFEDGEPIVRIYVPAIASMFKLPPANWELAQLFDGTRSYEEITALYSQKTGVHYDVEEVRDFAARLEAADFWFKTTQEKNILLMQQTAEERKKTLRVRSKWADLSEITFPAFNPDRFLTWIYERTRFIYTLWFTILTLLSFIVAGAITVTHWREIGHDTVQFYNFTNKTWGDIVALYVIGMLVVGIHEFAHAHACKQAGGRVPAMGFALIYLAPAFYTDTTEGTVKGTRFQRAVISMAGVWSEMMLCAVATPIWWATPPDTLIHNSAYYMMMLTGIMSLVVNWNPLMKLDGYYMLTELLGIADLKEDSTAFVSAWNKKYIWRLPADVPYVPRRRRLGFAIYAVLSGLYSYSVLYLVARFAGNIVRNFSPEWGFIPELCVAGLIFRSRIRLLVNFMKFVYLDKKDRILAWFTPRNSLIFGGIFAILVLLPLWHESVSGSFLLESANSVTIRAHVPGIVTEVLVQEGTPVSSGDVLVRLKNLPLESDLQSSQMQLTLASERANQASLSHSGYGAALKARDESMAQNQQLSMKASNLEVASPIKGTVLTPRVNELVGTYLAAGGELLEVADLSQLRARLYISEFDISRVQAGADGRMQVDGFFKKWDARATAVTAKSTEMDQRLLSADQLRGMNLPHYYLVDLYVRNPEGQLKPGMMGVARVYGAKRSLAGLAWTAVSNFFGRKAW